MSNLDHSVIQKLVAVALERTVFISTEPAPSQLSSGQPTYSATIKFGGQATGSLMLVATEGFARQLAAGFTCMSPGEVDLPTFGQDAMNELANIVGGQVVTALGGEHKAIRLGLPGRGDPTEFTLRPGDCITCHLDSMGDVLQIVYVGETDASLAA
jgi:CheY-specific phosphatase CheX